MPLSKSAVSVGGAVGFGENVICVSQVRRGHHQVCTRCMEKHRRSTCPADLDPRKNKGLRVNFKTGLRAWPTRYSPEGPS